MNALKELKSTLAEISDLHAAASLLAWDREVHMPSGTTARRASQSATLAGIHHRNFVTRIPLLLENAKKEQAGYSDKDLLILNQVEKELQKTLKIPEAFVRECTEVYSNAHPVWAKAKKENNFGLYQPMLEKILELKLRQSEYLGYENDPYDPHLDIYEPGLTATRFTQLFENFIPRLKNILDQTLAAKPLDTEFLNETISENSQLEWSKIVLQKIGFNEMMGRQDLSLHPFTISMGPEDVRITTVVDPNDITAMLFSTIHEAGHGIYEQGLPISEYGNPGCEPCSLGIHESQSRLYENNLARNPFFWEYWFESFSALFPSKLKGKTPFDIFRAVNTVSPTLIRIYADELTYHFHIWIRFLAEKELINKKLKIKELPEFWNAKIKEFLGLDVPTDAQGCLQDIHWAHGNFGYFPTYSLGSLYAAQFMAKAKSQNHNFDMEIKNGNFNPLKNWLNENVHSFGKTISSDALCTKATGESLNPDYFIAYIKDKMEMVYDIKIK